MQIPQSELKIIVDEAIEELFDEGWIDSDFWHEDESKEDLEEILLRLCLKSRQL